MPLYTIHAKNTAAGGDIGRLSLVREGFSRWAFAFGPLWLLGKRLWLALAIYAALAAGLFWLFRWLEFHPAASAALLPLINLYLGLEASAIERRKLGWLGYSFSGVAGGRTHDEAERKAAEIIVDGAKRAAEAPPASVFSPDSAEGIIGLFPESGGRA